MKRNRLSIGVDYQSAAQSGKSGVGYYTKGMVEALAEAYPDAQIYIRYYNFLNRSTVDTPDLPNIRRVSNKLIHPRLVNLLRRLGVELPFTFLLRKRCQAYFFPSFINHPVPKNATVITTIHDLAYIEVPESVSPRNRSDLAKFVPKYIKRSTRIATISEYTRSRIKEHYPDNPGIFVTQTPPSLKESPSGQTELLPPNTPKNYILFVGNIEPRKNLNRLLEAYEQLDNKIQKNYALVIAGGGGWNNQSIVDKIKLLRESGLTITTSGYVSEDELIALYTSASLFVFPSLYEGYGIPPLEAMQFNTPVVAADIPVLREVCLNAAYYCNPKDVRSITEAISKTLNDTSLQAKLQRNGRKHVKKITWQKAADILYKHLAA